MSYSEWVGLFAPGGVPLDIIKKLNEAAVEALADPAVRSRIVEFDARGLGALRKADADGGRSSRSLRSKRSERKRSSDCE